MQPLVSVIMPSLNQARFIKHALRSVLQQSWQHVEIIVQDGGSNDGTQALLTELAAQDPRIHWASAADNGPAEALNKALQRVKGTYIGWLNADDAYLPGAIERTVTAMQQHPEWMLCYGQGEHVDANGQHLAYYPTLPSADDPAPEVPDKSEFQNGCFICQPTVFFKAVMPRLIGTLDTRLGASFDFDYWLRAFNAFPKRIGYIPHPQAQSRLHDDTITQRQRKRVALEGMQILARHQGSAPGHWVLTYLEEQRRAGVSAQALSAELKTLLNHIQPWMQQDDWHALKATT
tara:strand:+ start:31166 stop:32035 length:870 start_codon:yes stop_codon:yes gene_type:complete